MAAIQQAPRYVRLGNVFTSTLLRAGVRLMGFGKYPMYLLTVRGRKSGQPRTVWVRNLRSAGEAVLTRGRRSETVSARELPPGEAALVLQEEVRNGHPFARDLGVTAESSLAEFEQAAITHPLFLLETK